MIGPRLLAVALAVAVLGSAPVRAQDAYPSKTITMIIPFAAGGSTDVIGRLVADGLRAVLGQSIVVDNRGGAGGAVGTAAIAKAAPDGYTIGMGTASTLAINPATYKSLPFDVLQDLVADRQHRRRAQHHVAAFRREGRDHGGVHRAGEGAAGQARLRLAGLRLGRASARRAVQARHRHRHPARALSRHGAGAQRRRRRAGAGGLRQSADVAGTGEVGQVARSRPVGGEAHRGAAGLCRPSANSVSTTSTGWRSSG